MRRQRVVLLVALGLILAGLLSACNPTTARSDQQDEKNPYFVKAKKLLNQDRDYKGALKYFQMAIDQDPNNAAAHLELGLLYEEKMQDYAYAIYHYRRYLELRPQTEKADLIQQFVGRCQLGIASSLKNSPIDCADEIARLHQESSNLVQQVDYLQKANTDMEQKLAKVSRAPDETLAERVVTQVVYAASPPVVTPPPTQARPAVPATSTAPPAVDASRPRTHIVQRGDTLSSISQKMYNRRDKWMVIYNANKAVVGGPPSYRLKVGQKLTIPNL